MKTDSHPVDSRFRLLLFPLALFYWGVIWWRNFFYRVGFFVSQRLPTTVVSVGNLTTGGTGKTPTVIALAELLKAQGYSVGIVSRGYGRTTRGTRAVSNGKKLLVNNWQKVGDEPLLMAQRLSGVPVVVDENRIRGGSWLWEHAQSEVILMDDAFQHRALIRDVDLVLINAGDWREDHKLLPYGLLREPWQHLKRADMVMLTKTNLHRPAPFLRKKLTEYAPRWTGITVEPDSQLVRPDRSTLPVTDIQGKKVCLLSAIGDPHSFYKTVSDLGVEILDHLLYPDHFAYTRQTVDAILDQYHTSPGEWLLTTEKDMIKLAPFITNEKSMAAVPIRTRFSPEGEKKLLSLLRSHVETRH